MHDIRQTIRKRLIIRSDKNWKVINIRPRVANFPVPPSEGAIFEAAK